MLLSTKSRLLRRWLPGSLIAMLAAAAAWNLPPNPSFAATARDASSERSASLTARDQKSIRAVVQGQLDAFARDDAVKAFSFAAPNVREAFVTAPRFLEMVQRGYPVVVRPLSVAFLKPEGKQDLAVQRVQITDRDGDLWLATYSLERQKNRAWRITGCYVTENKGQMT